MPTSPPRTMRGEDPAHERTFRAPSGVSEARSGHRPVRRRLAGRAIYRLPATSSACWPLCSRGRQAEAGPRSPRPARSRRFRTMSPFPPPATSARLDCRRRRHSKYLSWPCLPRARTCCMRDCSGSPGATRRAISSPRRSGTGLGPPSLCRRRRRSTGLCRTCPPRARTCCTRDCPGSQAKARTANPCPCKSRACSSSHFPPRLLRYPNPRTTKCCRRRRRNTPERMARPCLESRPHTRTSLGLMRGRCMVPATYLAAGGPRILEATSRWWWWLSSSSSR
mmetsp:Transcript_57493/g.166967  ORF Transcript_57493/g.166967 Transcript_57493/m.166967 type:complete len:280 (-) Transcript_57493:81-920(-)